MGFFAFPLPFNHIIKKHPYPEAVMYRYALLLISFLFSMTLYAGDSITESHGTGPSEDFSIILLPDTQKYTEKGAMKYNLYERQTRWIADNRDERNIRFVIHLGDITERNGQREPGEWEVAHKAHQILDDHNIPYSTTTGNHDYYSREGHYWNFKRNVYARNTDYGRYFGAFRFEDRSWYGGSFSEENINNYMTFEAGEQKFLVLSLEFLPRKSVLDWAHGVLEAHPDRKVIVVTHSYIDPEGEYATNRGRSWREKYYMTGVEGEAFDNEFLKQHSNIFLLLCGHSSGSRYKLMEDTNNGNPIHILLTDFQSLRTKWGRRLGNGWLRSLNFNIDIGRIGIEDICVIPEDSELGKSIFGSRSIEVPFEEVAAMYVNDLAESKENHRTIVGHSFMDFQVNDGMEPSEGAPVIACDGEGNFVVIWEEEAGEDERNDLFISGYSPHGNVRYGPVKLNGPGSRDPGNPDIAMNARGDYIVLWQDEIDGTNRVYGKAFDREGNTLVKERLICSAAGGDAVYPEADLSARGHFAVVWQEDGPEGVISQVKQRTGNLYARIISEEEPVHPEFDGYQGRPEAAVNDRGETVIVWEAVGKNRYEIFARGYGPNAFEAQRLEGDPVEDLRKPKIAMNNKGFFMVAWDNRDERKRRFDTKIAARSFGPGGVAIHDIKLMSHRQEAVHPEIDSDEQDHFVISWQDDRDRNGYYQIMAAVFNTYGASISGDRTVNADSRGQQKHPNVALGEKGYYYVVWQDDKDKDGDYNTLIRSLNIKD
jgi:hypothetical protein